MMNKTQQRIAIAEACGYTEVKPIYSGWEFELGYATKPKLIGIMGKFPTPTNCQPWIPDYLNDLNAMHEAERTLSDSQKISYYHALSLDREDTGEPTENLYEVAHATAAQRAEAFLRTLNLWED